jgi:hypothetical protein
LKLVTIFVLSIFVFLTIIACRVKDETQMKDIVYVDQGIEWTDEKRAEYYVWNQGSQLLPYAWMVALKDNTGHPFLTDGLKRYGLLPMEGRKLPVGFTLGKVIIGIHQVGFELCGLPYQAD